MTSVENLNLPLVSLLVPMYNVAGYIEDTIKLIHKQTYQNIEIIIVDDHSTDNSYELAKKYESPILRVLKNPAKGACSARNHAFTESRGTYIKFMDADDYCDSSLIEDQVKQLLPESNFTVAFSSLKKVFRDGTEFIPPRKIDKDYPVPYKILIDLWNDGGFNVPHCFLMHRDLTVKVNGWNEELLKNQDGEYFARIFCLSEKLLFTKGQFAYWRQTGIGISANLSLKAHSSMLKSFAIISKLILQYENTRYTKELCARRVGGFVYSYYPGIKEIMPDVYKLLDEFNMPLILPDRRILNLLKPLIGWEKALVVQKKWN